MFRLLLIDDSLDDRTLIIRELRREFPDLQIKEVVDTPGFNALNIGDFDIVITDYYLGWNDGLSIVGELKLRYPNCPIIMFTNSGNEEIAVEAMKAGVDDYITKSARNYTRLPMAVRVALKRTQDTMRYKQTEAALQESEERFRLLVESAKDYAIITLDCNGYITSWNIGAERILGYQEAEIIGQHGSCIFTPEDIRKGEDKKELEMAVAEGRAEDERWHVRANGKLFWASGIVTSLRDEAGNLQGFSKIMRDMTERKQAEAERDRLIEQLAAERRSLETVLQQMPVGVAIAEAPSGKLRCHNQEAVRILRHPMLPSDSVKDYVQYGAFHCDGRPYKPQEYPLARSTISGEVVKAEDMSYRRGDGTQTFLCVNSAPITDNGRIVAAVSTFYDIYERKQAEIALRSSEERLRLALEAAHMSIWDWNSQTNQVTWSDNYELLFGYAPGTFAGTYEAVSSCVHPEDRELVASALTRSLKQRVEYDAEFRIVCPDGNIRWLAAKGQFFYQESTLGVRMMGVIMDITERKSAAEQIKISLQETAELKRLNQLKDDFLSTVSHELRSPMASIKMAVSMLEVALKQAGLLNAEPNRVAQYLQILRNECDREINLINDLLDLSSLEAGNKLLCLSAIDLSSWVPPIVESFAERTRSQQQSLEVSIPNDLPTLITDESKLERLLSELLHNACKYTPASERILVTAKTKSDRLLLQVSNSGIEIPAAELSRIFDKFYRIPNNDPWKYGGTGLGLALVKKLVEHLDGTIQATASFGWTNFTVELPFTPTQ